MRKVFAGTYDGLIGDLQGCILRLFSSSVGSCVHLTFIMPITPFFSLSQSDEFVFVKIKLPYVKVSSTEIHCEGQDFTFYCRPYLLRLRLPFCLIDDERCRALIDLTDKNGAVTVYLPKQDHGRYYMDLDLTTKLLSLHTIENSRIGTSGNSSVLPISKIEVVNSEELHNIHGDDRGITDRKDATMIERMRV